MRTRVAVSGILDVFRLHGGQREHVLHKPNLVVDLGLSVISRILGGNVGTPTVGGVGFSDINDLAFRSMVLGVASAPPTPAPGDTTGVTALAFAPPVSITYPTSTSIRVEGVVPQTDFDGTTFTEEAILLSNGQLFAKTTFSELKTNAYGLLFAHTFTFGRA